MSAGMSHSLTTFERFSIACEEHHDSVDGDLRAEMVMSHIDIMLAWGWELCEIYSAFREWWNECGNSECEGCQSFARDMMACIQIQLELY